MAKTQLTWTDADQWVVARPSDFECSCQWVGEEEFDLSVVEGDAVLTHVRCGKELPVDGVLLHSIEDIPVRVRAVVDHPDDGPWYGITPLVAATADDPS